MVCLSHGACIKCGKEGQYNIRHTPVCSECRRKEQAAKDEAYLAPLREMTVEERLERLELLVRSLGSTARDLSLHHMKF